MILPEIEAALLSLDEHVGRVIPALQALEQPEKTRQTVAFSLGLAMRLTAFGLGPMGQLHPQEVTSCAMAILETIREIEQDLWPPQPPQQPVN